MHKTMYNGRPREIFSNMGKLKMFRKEERFRSFTMCNENASQNGNDCVGVVLTRVRELELE